MDFIRVSVSIDYILELVVMANKSMTVKVRENCHIYCLTDNLSIEIEKQYLSLQQCQRNTEASHLSCMKSQT